MSTALYYHFAELTGLNPYGEGETAVSERHPDINQDDFLVDYATGTYGVFDGLGRHAAHLAVRRLYEHYQEHPTVVASERVAYEGMQHVFQDIHHTLMRESSCTETTASTLHFFGTEDGEPRALVGNAGNSRVYRLRAGWRLGCLTLNKSLYDDPEDPAEAWMIQDYLDEAAEPDDLRSNYLQSTFVFRHMAGSSLGDCRFRHGTMPTYSIKSFDVAENDRFLLATKGIHDNLTTSEINEILQGTYDPKAAAQELITAAQERSRTPHLRASPDDMTAVVVNLPAHS